MNPTPFKLPTADPLPSTHNSERTPNHDYTRRRRGIYLLPNLLTIAGLFAGFSAIIAAIKGYFENAVIAIFIAMVMDFFDGRIARLTNTQSAFGAELDSLADIVSFGVAPALIAYLCSLFYSPKLGWLAAFLFVAAAALRLARFNTQANTMDKRYFQGLPVPAAAGVLISAVWLQVGEDAPLRSQFAIVMAILTLLTAMLMVSNIRYHSFKQLDFKGRVPFVTILLVVLLFAGISLDPPKILFLTFLSYTLWGPIFTLWTLHKTRSLRKQGL